MPKFRSKPVVIEAIQYDGKNIYDLVHWINHTQWDNGIRTGETAHGLNGDLVIPTLEGDMKANIGDWIIKGLNSEFYPCKPDIFAKKYEPEEEAAE